MTSPTEVPVRLPDGKESTTSNPLLTQPAKISVERHLGDAQAKVIAKWKKKFISGLQPENTPASA